MKRRLAIAVAFLALPSVAVAHPGDLDPSFGHGGKVSDPRLETPFAVTESPAGSLLVLGSAPNTGNLYTGLLRLTRDGSLDTSFGDRGMVAPAVRGGAVAVDPAARILVSGAGQTNSGAVQRLLSDGSSDPSFGEGGVVALQASGASVGYAPGLVARPGGGLYVAAIVTEGEDQGIGVFALAPDGLPDPSFGSNGFTFVGPGLDFVDGQLAILSDGSLIVAGSRRIGPPNYGDDIVLTSVRPDGTIDSEYGNGGSVVFDARQSDRLSSVAVTHDDQLLIAGLGCYLDLHGTCAPFGARIDSHGAVVSDLSSGLAGMNTIWPSVLPGPKADIYVAGSVRTGAPTGNDLGARRLGPDGSLRTSFGDDGTVFTDFGFGSEIAGEAAVTPQGLTLTGSSGGSARSRLIVVRYLLDHGPANADADALGDSKDGCPHRYSRKHDGCPPIQRDISIDFRGPPEVGGVLSAAAPVGATGCVAHRRVRLLRAGDGLDPILGRATTNREGEWGVPTPKHRAGVYALAPGRIAADLGYCARARSRD